MFSDCTNVFQAQTVALTKTLSDSSPFFFLSLSSLSLSKYIYILQHCNCMVLLASCANRSIVDKLAADIEAVEDGDIVCLGIKDEGRSNMTERLKQALGSIGAMSVNSISSRGSYAIIGIKSYSAALEAFDGSGRRVVIAKTFVYAKSTFRR